MYRLKVISGPQSGSSFDLDEGRHSIGREERNSIVIPSERISKTHCHLTVSGNVINIKDAGSTNGTFVNGVLSQKKSLRVGDQVRMGNVVLLIESDQGSQELALSNSTSHLSLVPSLPEPQLPDSQLAESDPFGDGAATSLPKEPPKDLVSRAKYFFDYKVMPLFYGLNFKFEWNNIVGFLLLFVALGGSFLTMPTLIDYVQGRILAESAKRAQFLARHLARMNEPILAAGGEDRLQVGDIDQEDGVLASIVVDLRTNDNRIMAPASKMNSNFSVGKESVIVAKAVRMFQRGVEKGIVQRSDENRVIALEPLKVFVKAQGKNVPVAVAVVVLDISGSMVSSGDAWMEYSNAIIWAGLLGVIAFFVLIKLTIKPFQILNEDIDRVLKGEMGQVTHEFKIAELNPLWEIINTALQRARSGGVGMGSDTDNASTPDEWIAPYKTIISQGKGWIGFAVDANRQVLWMNENFEEASGIRSNDSLGKTISEIARDQSFSAFCEDLMGRSVVGAPGVTEDYEFSGIDYRMTIVAAGKKPVTEVWIFMGSRKGDG